MPTDAERLANQAASLTCLFAEAASLRERLDVAVARLDRIADVVQSAKRTRPSTTSSTPSAPAPESLPDATPE